MSTLGANESLSLGTASPSPYGETNRLCWRGPFVSYFTPSVLLAVFLKFSALRGHSL